MKKKEEINENEETNEIMYRNLLAKLSELRVQQVSRMSGYDLDIIDKAYVPEDVDPDFPNWKLVIVIGCIISLCRKIVCRSLDKTRQGVLSVVAHIDAV